MELIKKYKVVSPIKDKGAKERGLHRVAISAFCLLFGFFCLMAGIDSLYAKEIVMAVTALMIGVVLVVVFGVLWSKFWKDENNLITNSREIIEGEVMELLPDDMSASAKAWCADRTWYMFSSPVAVNCFGYVPIDVLAREEGLTEVDIDAESSGVENQEDKDAAQSDIEAAPNENENKDITTQTSDNDSYIAYIEMEQSAVSVMLFRV